LPFVAYDMAASTAVHAVLGPIERLRIWKSGSRIAALDERMGRWQPPPRRPTSQGRRFLVHAVSVGEVAAAGALITALGETVPELSVILSTGNREGRAAAESLRRVCPAIEAVTYLPWDRGRAVREWLERMAPEAMIVVETEIWPNLFRASGELGVPLFIVNGRIYPRDAARYALARRFFSRVLDAASWIGVQSIEDRNAFVRMGADADRVEVVGHLKADSPSREAEIPDGWRARIEADPSPLVIAGSTHHPEERILLEAFRELRASLPDLRLILAPRHPDRAVRLRRRAEAMSFSAALWSSGPAPDWEVLLIDRIGPLAALSGLADVVVIGGSLARRGGHNPLEAAAYGRSIVIGPSYEHFKDVVEELNEAGGIRVLPMTDDPVEAIRVSLLELLADSDQRRAMGQRARDLLRSHQGMAERYARSVMTRLGTPDQP
jgi:3-deoxy-D-manno-octulosonic-acid transferase